MTKEKQLTIALLTEKLEKLTEKKIILESDEKVVIDNPDKCFVFIRYINAYTEGITGRNITNFILVGPDGDGFNSREEAITYYRSLKKTGKFKDVITRKTQEYGNLGHFYSKPVIVKGKKFNEFNSQNLYKNAGYRIMYNPSNP